MRIVILGAGRVATHMVKALHKNGHKIDAVWSRTMESAQRLARVVDSSPVNDISVLPTDADAYIIAVKDSALQEVIAKATKGREGSLFLHTAGSMPLSVFEGYAKNGGVFYPMQTFSMEREVDFRAIPLFIEGADARIRQLAESISEHVYELSSDDRKYLHLAAVFACNFANHCYTLAAEVLEKKGLPFDVMLPLVDETARKVHELHPKEAQTGPAIRGDKNVMAAQAALLDSRMQAIYNLMSESIQEKA